MIELKNVSKWYGSFQVLSDCTTSIKKGEVVVICGPSGSGKSTLIKTMNALEPFQTGEISVDGVQLHDPKTNLPKLRARVGMVFQKPNPFPKSIFENLSYGLTINGITDKEYIEKRAEYKKDYDKKRSQNLKELRNEKNRR